MGCGPEDKQAKTTEPCTVSKTPQVAQVTERLIYMPTIDLGEQVFGSDHTFNFLAFNGGSTPATVTAWVDGADALSLKDSPRRIAPAQTADPFKIKFAPSDTAKRSYKGMLYVQAVWLDGTISLHTAPITARARSLDEVPSHEPTDAERAAEDAVRDAGTAAESLAAAQLAGVRLAEREIGSYEKVPPHQSITWMDLVQIAIEIGLSFVSESAGHMISKGLAEFAKDAHKVAESAPMAGLAEAVKESIERAGHVALHAHAGEAHGGDGGSPEAGGTFSDNAKIDFFSVQESVLVDAGKQNALAVSERAYYVEPMLRTDPGLAIDAMTAVGTALQAASASKDIMNTQALGTESQWIALVARRNLGEEKVATYRRGNVDSVNVTDLSKARPKNPDRDPGAQDGLLDVLLDFSPPKVVHARLTGVASEVARRLWNQTPASLNLPIRLVIGHQTDHPLIITRDEAGRVRMSGDRQLLNKVLDDPNVTSGTLSPDEAGTVGQSEEQALVVAGILLDKVWTVPLKTTIGTDDATGVEE